jgi:hypothetical protein
VIERVWRRKTAMNRVLWTIGDKLLQGIGHLLIGGMMPESVTHVAGLFCYLCTWTIPRVRLTNACSGARGGSFLLMASIARAPGDARR